MPESKLRNKFSASSRFLKSEIWRLQARKLDRRKLYYINPLRVLLLAIRRFFEDKCELRASALTFYTLLSIVPVVAMAFGVAKGFGLEKILEAQLLSKLEGQPEIADRLIGFARSLLENTKGGAIAGVGVGVLFWSVIKVLGNIEKALNDIWGILRSRTLGRKLADYLSMMLICPVLLIIASSATVIVTTQVTAMVEKLAFLGPAGGVIIFLIKFLPYTVIWFLFSFLYVFMPNTKVQLKSAVWGGILAGTIYQLTQYAYIKFQVGVSSYGAIYGSFAALPLFLAWLQLSWLIVLFGAEVSFAHQNVAAYEFAADCASLSHRFKRTVALFITNHCVKAFIHGKNAPTAEAIAQELEIPIRLVRSTIFELTEARILAEVRHGDLAEIGYQPGCPLDQLTINKILAVLDRHGADTLPLADSPSLDKLREITRKFDEILETAPANLKIQDL
ncbi:MAG TPA: YihY/virulence factor BrkB family protein [Candidatus Binatia bacterium]|nr:YihY/virulence factor BrkB family protein [Candidatus Binatia bacterium]